LLNRRGGGKEKKKKESFSGGKGEGGISSAEGKERKKAIPLGPQEKQKEGKKSQREKEEKYAIHLKTRGEEGKTPLSFSERKRGGDAQSKKKKKEGISLTE